VVLLFALLPTKFVLLPLFVRCFLTPEQVRVYPQVTSSFQFTMRVNANERRPARAPPRFASAALAFQLVGSNWISM